MQTCALAAGRRRVSDVLPRFRCCTPLAPSDGGGRRALEKPQVGNSFSTYPCRTRETTQYVDRRPYRIDSITFKCGQTFKIIYRIRDLRNRVYYKNIVIHWVRHKKRRRKILANSWKSQSRYWSILCVIISNHYRRTCNNMSSSDSLYIWKQRIFTVVCTMTSLLPQRYRLWWRVVFSRVRLFKYSCLSTVIECI